MNSTLAVLIIFSLLLLSSILDATFIHNDDDDNSSENYTLLKNMGKFPLDIKETTHYLVHPSDNTGYHERSAKYQGHRYEKHRVRSNPHTRRYQDPDMTN